MTLISDLVGGGSRTGGGQSGGGAEHGGDGRGVSVEELVADRARGSPWGFDLGEREDQSELLIHSGTPFLCIFSGPIVAFRASEVSVSMRFLICPLGSRERERQRDWQLKADLSRGRKGRLLTWKRNGFLFHG